MAHMMLESKRASRGKRMTSLVGQAAEDDEAFWGHEVWNEEGSDADSFVAEEEKPDEFDSDFDETESEEESDSEEEKEATRTRKAQDKTVTTSRYKDPKIKPKRTIQEVEEGANAAEPAPPRKKKSPPAEFTGKFVPRSVRDSTKLKTQDADVAREKRFAEARDRTKYVRPEKPTFTQKRLLDEALNTEEENYRWLQFRKYEMSLLDEAKKAEQKQRSTSQDFIRFKSDKNNGNTITFSNAVVIPAILRPEFNERPPAPKQAICAITGLPAKYWDPKTDLPYANIAAFRELRRCFPLHQH